MKKTYEKPRVQTLTSSEVVEAMGPVQGYGQGLKGTSNLGKSSSSGAGPFAISRR
jgi:hypothetical protein